jgi:hypothetical protein
MAGAIRNGRCKTPSHEVPVRADENIEKPIILKKFGALQKHPQYFIFNNKISHYIAA